MRLIHLAIGEGQIDALRPLIERRADVNAEKPMADCRYTTAANSVTMIL